MKTIYLNRYLVALCLLFAYSKGYSQCAAPSAGTATAAASTCVNNGKITITGVSGGAAVDADTTLEYTILSYTGDAPSSPVIYQSSNVFNNLYPGSYTIGIRHNCQGTYSGNYVISDVNVTDSYTPMTASITVNYQQSNCRKGKMTVSAANGYTATAGAYRYQLVTGLTAGIWDTLAAKQTSNIFLVSAGTYYVRIYDDCGSYITRSVVMDGGSTASNPYALTPYNKKRFARTACGVYAYQFFHPGALNKDVTNLAPTNAKTYLVGPAGLAIDSSVVTTTGTKSVDITAYLVPANAKVTGGVTVYGPFYEKIKDSCGAVFASDTLYIDTTYNVTAALTRSAPRCDTADYTLSITEAGTSFSGVSMSTKNFRVRASNIGSSVLEYTNDSGVTWTTNPVTSNVISTAVFDQKWGVRVTCGDTSWATAPSVNLLSATLVESNAWACIGNTGIVLNPNSNFGSGTYAGTTVKFTAAPAAYANPLTMTFTNKGKNAANAADPDNYLFNLPLGNYSYVITNECGETSTGTLAAGTGRSITAAITASGNCETGKIQVMPAVTTLQHGSSAINTAGGATRLKYTIRNSHTGIYINSLGAAGNTGSITPSVADRGLTIAGIDAPDTGWYVITVWPDTAFLKTHGYCAVQDSVHISAVGSALRATSDFNACKSDGTGSIIIAHTGGLPPYKYEVLDVTSGVKYGPKTTNEFSGLDVSHVYEARITDTCGNTSSNRNTFDTVSTQVIIDGKACAGANVVLRANDVPGGIYRWVRGTDTVSYVRTLPLNSISNADTGKYIIVIRTATCDQANIDSINFKVNPIPAKPVTATVNYCTGVTAVAVTATGTSLKWYPAASGGTGVTTAPVPVTTDADTFIYYVSQTSAAGCESPRADLTVNVNPLPGTAPVVVTPVTYCSGVAPVALTATGTSLFWYTVPTGGTGTATAPTPATGTAGTTKYYVAQRSPEGCAGPRAEIAVVVNATPAAPSVTTPVAYCLNATTTALTATGTTLKWYTDGSTTTGTTTAPTPASNVVRDSNFYVSQTSAENCEGSRSVIMVRINPLPAEPVVASPLEICSGTPVSPVSAIGTNLKWYTDATGGTGSATAPAPATATVTTINYYVSQTDALGCEGARDTLVVNINPLPTVSIAPRERSMPVFCVGSTVTIDASSATATGYQWSLEGTDLPGATYDSVAAGVSGTFKVTVTNVYGCKATASVTVKQDTTVMPSLTPGTLSVCIGDSGILSCRPGLSIYSFNWMKDGVLMTPATPTLSSRFVHEPGVYTVNVINGYGCPVLTNAVTMTNYPALVKPTVIRTGRTLSLSNTYDYYEWYKNGLPIPAANASTYFMPSDGNYHAVVKDRNGCQINSDTLFADRVGIQETAMVKTVKVYPNPTQSKVTIEATAGVVNVTVTDITGHLILRREKVTEIDLADFADGMYLMNITDENGTVIGIEKINKVSSR